MQQTKPPESGTMQVAGAEVAYLIVRSAKRRRSVEFRFDAARQLVFRAPLRTSTAHIRRLMAKHEAWIVRQLARLHAAPAKVMTAFVDGNNIDYLGKPLRLEVQQAPSRIKVARHKGSRLRITGESLDADAVRAAVHGWLRQQATTRFPRRVALWARRMNLPYGRVLVSNPRRQWASCSYKNDLRFSWRLIMVPPRLLDYVVVHELAHVVQKNHSAAFWRLVEATLPDYRQRRKELQALGSRVLP
ncbi:MAG: M48 family metallopeptidase [Pseudomonadaceae bacterium]|nr:M48 family metallopeptidase [Pseudomonadaceae bacterium]